MEQFFRVELRTFPCMGRYQTVMICQSGEEKHDFSAFSKSELPEIISQSLANYTGVLSCTYTYSFEGNWCEVNGGFDLVFAAGNFITVKNVERTYWEE